MSVILRFTPVNNLLGLRIDNESDGGADAPSVIVIFREQGVGTVSASGTGIDDFPVEEETTVVVQHGRALVDPSEGSI